MITLGLDPSLAGFGWCVHDGTVAGESRVLGKGVLAPIEKPKPKKTDDPPTKPNPYLRYLFLRDSITSLLNALPEIQAVGVESPIFGAQQSEGAYGLFLYVNEAIMLARKDVVYFDPLRVKLLAKMDPEVRKGRMDKTDMIDIAKQDTGISKWNHNEADAYIVARSAARFWDLYEERITEEDLTPAELQVFIGRHEYVRGPKAGKTIERGVLFREANRFFRFSELKDQDLELGVPTTFSRLARTSTGVEALEDASFG